MATKGEGVTTRVSRATDVKCQGGSTQTVHGGHAPSRNETLPSFRIVLYRVKHYEFFLTGSFIICMAHLFDFWARGDFVQDSPGLGASAVGSFIYKTPTFVVHYFYLNEL